MAATATLCPAGMASRATTRTPSTTSAVPGEMGTRATATLSAGFRWMAKFSGVGRLAMSDSTGLYNRRNAENPTPGVARPAVGVLFVFLPVGRDGGVGAG